MAENAAERRGGNRLLDSLAEFDSTSDSTKLRLGDLHVRIWLGGFVFDYVASAVAVHHLVGDCSRKRWFAIELPLENEDMYTLPRLPNERLYFGP
ncbi:hypothetical protein ACIBJI_07925 [Nocardia sp. NPDC050408]|uniref:hypothetical protein n=1 Tax=Nocardia sp. NPDC050408 TaxID=3364319 RepID=UPI0037B785F8